MENLRIIINSLTEKNLMKEVSLFVFWNSKIFCPMILQSKNLTQLVLLKHTYMKKFAKFSLIKLNRKLSLLVS